MRKSCPLKQCLALWDTWRLQNKDFSLFFHVLCVLWNSNYWMCFSDIWLLYYIPANSSTKKLYCVGCRVLSASYDFMSKQVVKKQTIFNFHNYSFILHTLHQKLIYFQWYTLLFIGLMQQTMNVHILTGWIAEQLKKLQSEKRRQQVSFFLKMENNT